MSKQFSFPWIAAAYFCLAAAELATAAPHTQVRLMLAAESAKPGETVVAGVELRMPAHWHTYWRNPGDSGQATQIHWRLPKGISAGPVQWPVPEKLITPPLTTYVYSSNVVLLVPLHVATNAGPGLKEISATVSWLECGQICVPAKADVQARLIVGPIAKPSADAALLQSWAKRSPAPAPISALNLAHVQARWEALPQDDSRPLIIEGENSPGGSVDFYPLAGQDYDVAGETEALAGVDHRFALRKIVRKLGTAWPSNIQGLLVKRGNQGEPPQAMELTLVVLDAPKH